MAIRIWATATTLLLTCCIGMVSGDDQFRCNAYQGTKPPELLSQAEHWVSADRKETVTLELLRGKVVWLQFNFCESCTPMRRQLTDWRARYGADLHVIEVDGGKFQSLAKVRECVVKRAVGHLVLWDADNQNHQRYGVKAWPSAYLIGRDGNVLWQGNPRRVLKRPEQLQMLLCHIEAELHIAEDAIREPPVPMEP